MTLKYLGCVSYPFEYKVISNLLHHLDFVDTQLVGTVNIDVTIFKNGNRFTN